MPASVQGDKSQCSVGKHGFSVADIAILTA
uniref:Uncharacterized protein n=1 Tax=Arundo donax TaxID=35708 RepID=A0A0A9FDT1_ARUDO